MARAVIVSAVRTPFTRVGGGLASVPATELGAAAIRGGLERAGLSGEDVGYVVMGQVLQAGAGQAPARQAAIAAGIPKEVPADTINKVCASSIRAIEIAELMIATGRHDVVVTGGMESMSRAPYLLPKARFGYRLGNGEVLDHVVPPGGDHQLGELERPDRRCADLVDRVRGNLLRNPRADRCLPRGRLARARLEHLAHHHVADVVGLDVGALEAGADRDRPQLGRRNLRETASEPAERRSNRRDDDGASHCAVSVAALHSEARRTVSDTVFCQGPTRAKFVPIAPRRSRRIARTAAGRYARPAWLPLAP